MLVVVVVVVVVLDGLWSWRLPRRKKLCRWFPRKIAVLRFCLYSPSTSKMSGIGTLCACVRLPASRVDRQSNFGCWTLTKNLLFIVRIYCPRFWFWTGILRPLVSFSSPLQQVGILCVCPCLVVFVRYICMIQNQI